jgi:hypothetical protein
MVQETQAQPASPPNAAAEAKYTPKLPKQVQAQVDAVNAALAAGEPMADGAIDEHAQLGPGEPAAAPGQQPPQPGQPQPSSGEPPAEEMTWEQRARSAMGRLDTALNANQQLSNRVGDLEQQIAMLRMNGSTQPAQPATPPPPPALIQPQERNDYGDEFFDVVGRRAKEVYAPEFDVLSARLKRLEEGQQGIGQVIQQTQRRTMYDVLYEDVPEWKEINHHPAFHQWLSFPDPYSGLQRHQLLQDAFSRQDADRVVAFFQGFLAEASGPPTNSSGIGTSAPPLVNPGSNAPGNGNGSGRPTLEDFAAPGRARSAPQELPPDKPVYTQAQIAKFGDEKRRGLWRGREAEVEAIERDIFQAQHEGRIQP